MNKLFYTTLMLVLLLSLSVLTSAAPSCEMTYTPTYAAGNPNQAVIEGTITNVASFFRGLPASWIVPGPDVMWQVRGVPYALSYPGVRYSWDLFRGQVFLDYDSHGQDNMRFDLLFCNPGEYRQEAWVINHRDSIECSVRIPVIEQESSRYISLRAYTIGQRYPVQPIYVGAETTLEASLHYLRCDDECTITWYMDDVALEDTEVSFLDALRYGETGHRSREPDYRISGDGVLVTFYSFKHHIFETPGTHRLSAELYCGGTRRAIGTLDIDVLQIASCRIDAPEESYLSDQPIDVVLNVFSDEDTLHNYNLDFGDDNDVSGTIPTYNLNGHLNFEHSYGEEGGYTLTADLSYGPYDGEFSCSKEIEVIMPESPIPPAIRASCELVSADPNPLPDGVYHSFLRIEYQYDEEIYGQDAEVTVTGTCGDGATVRQPFTINYPGECQDGLCYGYVTVKCDSYFSDGRPTGGIAQDFIMGITGGSTYDFIACEGTIGISPPGNHPPQVDISFPFDWQEYGPGTIQLMGTINDPDGDDFTYNWYCSPSSVGGICPDLPPSASSNSYPSSQIDFLVLGTYQICLQAFDSNSAYGYDCIHIDVVPPICQNGVKLYDAYTDSQKVYCCGDSDGVCPEDYSFGATGRVECPPLRELPSIGHISCTLSAGGIISETCLEDYGPSGIISYGSDAGRFCCVTPAPEPITDTERIGDPDCMPPEDCTNRVDDNGNGLIDCYDSDCCLDSTCTLLLSNEGAYNKACCSDGVDNDHDTFIDTADNQCGAAVCGNYILDQGEACDQTAATGRDCLPSACNPDCTCLITNLCGNSVIDPGEQCDDGNTMDCDSCDSNCIFEICGNDIIQCGEVCDGDSIGSCSACTSACICAPGGDIEDSYSGHFNSQIEFAYITTFDVEFTDDSVTSDSSIEWDFELDSFSGECVPEPVYTKNGETIEISVGTSAGAGELTFGTTDTCTVDLKATAPDGTIIYGSYSLGQIPPACPDCEILEIPAIIHPLSLYTSNPADAQNLYDSAQSAVDALQAKLGSADYGDVKNLLNDAQTHLAIAGDYKDSCSGSTCRLSQYYSTRAIGLAGEATSLLCQYDATNC